MLAPINISGSLLSLNLFTSLFTLFLFSFFLYQWFFNNSAARKILPPSPPKLPIIGNLHQLGEYPCRSLQALSQKYGNIMLLHLGCVPTLIVSSADLAREIMKTHDLIFSNRPKLGISRRLLYDGQDVSLAPYGEYWRQTKSICVLHLLSNTRVRSFRHVREEETSLMIEKIREHGSLPVNLSEMFMKFSNDVLCRVAFGRKYSGQDAAADNFKELLKEFVKLLGVFYVGDYIPWLNWINRPNGLDARVDRVSTEFDEFLDRVVEEHLESPSTQESGEKQKDFVDVLLEIQMDGSFGFPIDRNTIKALLLDMFAAGTDTTYTVLEWTMTELLRHPDAMKQVQEEVREVTQGRTTEIGESDLEKMTFLRAVIKETLRLHPPIPLLVPRESIQDVKINGFDIAAGTQIIINAWAIQRDPASWEEPEEFRPGRFLNSEIDYWGQDFQLIPFGAGRRSCPGISFARANNEHILACLLKTFNWEFPGPGTVGEDHLDLTESTGFTAHRKHPLFAVAAPYYENQ